MNNTSTAALLISCKDSDGIIASVTALLSRLGANILFIDQHVDHESNLFFMRVEWELENFSISEDEFKVIFTHEVSNTFDMTWQLHHTAKKQKMAIFVSKYAHCFFDLLGSWKTGDLNVDIPVIISNHEDLRADAEKFGIEYIHLPTTAANREEMAIEQMKILKDHNIDFVVLARYMQIIPESMIQEYQNKIINIHHSFLPSFPGAKPYHQAYQRGVKIIGATGHYVTEELDEGPIIAQDIERVNHTYSVKDLIRTGQGIEKRVLTQAVKMHIERRVLAHNNRTVVFS